MSPALLLPSHNHHDLTSVPHRSAFKAHSFKTLPSHGCKQCENEQLYVANFKNGNEDKMRQFMRSAQNNAYTENVEPNKNDI